MPLTPFQVPAGSQVYIGSAANPMPQAVAAAIGAAARATPGILEAHLPQVFAPPAMPAPAQVLVVVVNPATDVQSTLNQLAQGVERGLPPGADLTLWPMTERSGLLPDVREANSRIA